MADRKIEGNPRATGIAQKDPPRASNLPKMGMGLLSNLHLRDDPLREIKDPITGDYNELYLRMLLEEEITRLPREQVGMLAGIGIDAFSDYQGCFGTDEGDRAIQNVSYLLRQKFRPGEVFRMSSFAFGLYLGRLSRQAFVQELDELRVAISRSELFLQRVTISAGLALPDEIPPGLSPAESAAYLVDRAAAWLQNARQNGKNRVTCAGNSSTQGGPLLGVRPCVLLVDTDETNLALIKSFLNTDGIEVITATNGLKARELAMQHLPRVIVSEIILNQMDGFALREELNRISSLKHIETVFLSLKKDEESVLRAYHLGVTHYLRKPYMLTELIGIIRHLYFRGEP